MTVANYSHTHCDNDDKLMRAAQTVMEDLRHAARAADLLGNRNGDT